jgi:arylsulfatase A-like enzyme
VRRPLGEVLQERFAEITAMDRSIGTLRRSLKEQGLRENTLLWYCGDNGTPSSGLVASPFRGQKGQVYEGGIRVPGIIEWPARIPTPRVSDVNAVTSDMLPTLCDLTGQPVGERPLDGISLKPLIDGQMTTRPTPIEFWSYETKNESNQELKPYIPAKLQEGTTPLVKMLGGRFTRNFTNFQHPQITKADTMGPRAILDNNYKLVINGRHKGESVVELFDLSSDPGEKTNLVKTHPEIAKRLEKQLRDWQTSVLESLMGKDYR